MIRLFINGKEYTDNADGIENFQLSFAVDGETGFNTISLSSSIKATGKFFDLIYNELFADTCNGKDTILKGSVRINKRKCDLEIPVEIAAENVDLCLGDGCAEIVLRKSSPDNDAFECLKNQVNFWAKGKQDKKWISNGFQDYIVKNKRNYKILYCNDFGIISWIVFSLAQTISIFVDAAQLICKVIKFLGFDTNINFCGYIEKYERLVIGCTKYHFATLVKDIYEYNAELCKLKFDSQLFQTDPVYSCLAIESAVENEGFAIENCGEPTRQYNPGNQENWNLLQLSVKLRPVFNLYTIIRNGKLIVDHISRRYTELVPLINIDEEYAAGNVADCPVYSVDPTKFSAYWTLQYQRDGLDSAGNKMINEYNETVEWNPGGKRKLNKGEYLNLLEFAPKRFNNDVVVLQSGEKANLAAIRQLGGTGFINGECKFKHAQVLSDGQIGYSKLLIIDKQEKIDCSGCSFATTIKKKISDTPTQYGNVEVYDYNYPMKGQALYDRFHSIDDPSTKTARYINVEDVTWTPDDFCSAVNIIFANNLEVNVESSKYGNAHPQTIRINFETCEITLGGMAYKCEK